MRFARRISFFALFVLLLSAGLAAQVTTATIYGLIRDSSGAVLPGVSVTVTNQGTNLTRDTVSDERGEFALPALPAGRYTVRIEFPGFKTYTNDGLQLGAGQTVRQNYVLEVGQLTENITVAAEAPLVQTATAAQQETLGVQEVRELPLARRNITGLLGLAAGARQDGRNLQLNGIGQGGVGITVDGTDATNNPEIRSLGTYGGRNRIDVMSIDAVSEVQIAKGILPAEQGGFAGGQVNFITRSGTNEFHGSAFYNYQNEALSARDPFLAASAAKPTLDFNQYGGSLGGPIVRNRAHFFTAYEGYRETAGTTYQGIVPTQAFRDRILQALPFYETRVMLDTLALPNEPLNADVGRYRTVKDQRYWDNTLVTKGDVVLFNGNLSLTYNRMRPYSESASHYLWPFKDRKPKLAPECDCHANTYDYTTDRIAAQYVLSRRNWVSETRYGWNRSDLDRVHNFWDELIRPDLAKPPERHDVSGRIGFFRVLGGGISTPLSEVFPMQGRTFNFDQKLSHVRGKHNVKFGFRWFRQGGWKSDPTIIDWRYTSNATLLANTPSAILLSYGQPPHDGIVDEYGGFIQDDWRLTQRLVLNLGLRYDAYPVFKVRATSDRPAVMQNLEPPTDFRKMDFGAPRPADKPYDPDYNNFGPRAGFAWTIDESGKTVVRGGVGLLFSAHALMWLDFSVSDPYIPLEVQWNATEVAARGVKWPMYSEDLLAIHQRDTGGKPSIFALNAVELPNPYTVQTMFSVQRSFGDSWMAEVGYTRTDGRNFPLSRKMSKAFDRETGARPNPALGAASGYYKSSEQTTVYNALQTSVRKRFSNNFSAEVHYTLSKGWAEQGGQLTSDFVNTDIGQQQEFFDPFLPQDRGPLNQEARHRTTASAIYELPWLRGRGGLVSGILGGWQLSSILNQRSGLPIRLAQTSGIDNSRPDSVPGVDPVFDDWAETLRYLNSAAFARVPTYPLTGATIRPGTQSADQLRGPHSWTVDLSLAKNFNLTESVRLQFRADFFNALNHVNYNSPQTSITSPEFGLITSAGPPRSGQVAFRLTF
jgi:hypothetical protein